MGLFDLFKPKWRHSDPAVREEAVRALSDSDASVLAQVARTDPDSRIRRVAMKKIQDADILLEISDAEQDDALRRVASERAHDLLLASAIGREDEEQSLNALARIKDQRVLAEVARRAGLRPVQLAALARIEDQRQLAELARGAEDPALRLDALSRISDADLLIEVAREGHSKDVALKALERVGDKDALRDIAERGRSKAVRALARQRLSEDTEPQAGGEQARQAAPARTRQAPRDGSGRAQRLELCRIVEAALKQSDVERARRDVGGALDRWAELPSLPEEDELRRRFDRAIALFEEREERMAREAQRRAELAERKANEERIERERHAARVALCERVERATGDHVDVLIAEARAAWGQIEPPLDARSELVRRFNRACEEVRRRRQAGEVLAHKVESFTRLCEEAEALTGPPPRLRRELRELERRWRELAHGGKAPEELEGRMAKAREHLLGLIEEDRRTLEARQAEWLERALALCQRMEALVENGERRQVLAALKHSQALLGDKRVLPRERQAEITARLGAARDKLRLRLHDLDEMEEWKRWANVPHFEKLCERVEGLKDEPDADLAQKRMREAQRRWKELGALPADRAEALWKRFAAACDAVHAHAEERLGVSREENLKRKEELCARAEALLTTSDIKQASETLKALQAEWRTVGPAPKEKSDEVWQRFRAACQAFVEKRREHYDIKDEERAKNLAQLTELCERAEALVAARDSRAAAQRIKEYQAQWKKIGPPPKAESEAVWKRFRAACDQIFGQRKEEHARIKEEQEENLRQKEALCQEVEERAAREELSDDQASDTIREYMGRWKKIGRAPKAQADAVWKRFRAACDRLRQRDLGYSEEQLQAAADPNAPRFENRLPLKGLAEKLAILPGGESKRPDR